MHVRDHFRMGAMQWAESRGISMWQISGRSLFPMGLPILIFSTRMRRTCLAFHGMAVIWSDLPGPVFGKYANEFLVYACMCVCEYVTMNHGLLCRMLSKMVVLAECGREKTGSVVRAQVGQARAFIHRESWVFFWHVVHVDPRNRSNARQILSKSKSKFSAQLNTKCPPET